MLLPGLSITAFIFAASLILLFRPYRMADAQTYRTELEKVRWALSICQTTVFGRPVVTLRPNRRQVTMRLEFQCETRVLLVMPLVLKKQQADKDRLLALLREAGDEVVAYAPNGQTVYLRATLDRTDEALPETVERLYAEAFGVEAGAKTNIEVETLAVDGSLFHMLFKQSAKPKEGRLPRSNSRRHGGHTTRAIMLRRLMFAANLLLYPPMINLIHHLAGLRGVASAVFVLAVVVFGRSMAKWWTSDREHNAMQVVHDHAGGLTAATLSGIAFSTGDMTYLFYLPMAFGAHVCWHAANNYRRSMETASAGASDAGSTGRWPTERWAALLCMSLGVLVVFLGIWARTALTPDQWVRFYAFLRLELILGIFAVALPVIVFVVTFFDEREEPPKS